MDEIGINFSNQFIFYSIVMAMTVQKETKAFKNDVFNNSVTQYPTK